MNRTFLLLSLILNIAVTAVAVDLIVEFPFRIPEHQASIAVLVPGSASLYRISSNVEGTASTHRYFLPPVIQGKVFLFLDSGANELSCWKYQLSIAPTSKEFRVSVSNKILFLEVELTKVRSLVEQLSKLEIFLELYKINSLGLDPYFRRSVPIPLSAKDMLANLVVEGVETGAFLVVVRETGVAQPMFQKRFEVNAGDICTVNSTEMLQQGRLTNLKKIFLEPSDRFIGFVGGMSFIGDNWQGADLTVLRSGDIRPTTVK